MQRTSRNSTRSWPRSVAEPRVSPAAQIPRAAFFVSDPVIPTLGSHRTARLCAPARPCAIRDHHVEVFWATTPAGAPRRTKRPYIRENKNKMKTKLKKGCSIVGSSDSLGRTCIFHYGIDTGKRPRVRRKSCSAQLRRKRRARGYHKSTATQATRRTT